MRIFFLSNLGVYDHHLINEVARRFTVCGVIRPGSGLKNGRRLNWKSLFRKPLIIAGNILSRPYRKFRDSLSRRAGLEAFFDGKQANTETEVIDLPGSVNDPDSVEIIRRLQPDVVIVSNAPMLKPEVFQIPRLACLNIHQGIAPNYRGEHSVFWALLVGDYSHIGTTIHYIDEGVDTGAALARGYPALEPNDTECSIRVKNTEVAVGMLLDILGKIKDRGSRLPVNEQTVANSADSKLIRYSDRKIWHEISLAWRRYVLGKCPPAAMERVERNY